MLESNDKEMQNLGITLAMASCSTFGDYQRFKHIYLNGNQRIRKHCKIQIRQKITSNLNKIKNGN